MRDHDALIDELSREMRPVRRVAPAWLRTLGWVPVALALGYAATLLLVQRQPTDWLGVHAGVAIANVVVSMALGIGAFASALSISVAGGRDGGRWWFVAGVVAWALLASVSIALAPEPRGALMHGSNCFTFVVVAGAPMIAVVVLALRRTRSLTPGRSLATAGLGIAFLSFGLLAFCHPAELSVADLIMHLLAALVLGGGTVLLGRPVIRA